MNKPRFIFNQINKNSSPCQLLFDASRDSAVFKLPFTYKLNSAGTISEMIKISLGNSYPKYSIAKRVTLWQFNSLTQQTRGNLYRPQIMDRKRVDITDIKDQSHIHKAYWTLISDWLEFVQLSLLWSNNPMYVLSIQVKYTLYNLFNLQHKGHSALLRISHVLKNL
jgi:hypothetical protein